jgi:hypothetical protein
VSLGASLKITVSHNYISEMQEVPATSGVPPRDAEEPPVAQDSTGGEDPPVAQHSTGAEEASVAQEQGGTADPPAAQDPSGAEDPATSEDPSAAPEAAVTGTRRGGLKKRKVQEAMGSEDRRYVSDSHATLRLNLGSTVEKRDDKSGSLRMQKQAQGEYGFWQISLNTQWLDGCSSNSLDYQPPRPATRSSSRATRK